MKLSIPFMLKDWSRDDLGNLGALLKVESGPTEKSIEDRFKWLYYSRTRVAAESAATNLWRKVTKSGEPTKVGTLRSAPSYSELLQGACAFVKASEKDASVSDMELFLSQAVIIAALQRMAPRKRLQFFHEQVDVAGLCSKAGLKGADIRGPVTTFTALGFAQASGVGIFLASSTALGFLTHAVGITLPFIVYTGLSSTIAFVIGPVGWLSAGIWGTLKLTEPEWKRIIPGLIYMIAVNSRRGLEGST